MKMLLALRIGLSLLLAGGGLTLDPAEARSIAAARADLTACAAAPVPLPPSRPVSAGISEAIRARVETWQSNRRRSLPGISVALRWDDGRTVTAVSGEADTSTDRKIVAGTPFALASVTKPFTAVIALLLDACGVLPLETRVSSLVSYADVRSDATIEDLLRHESGMSDWLTDLSWRMGWLIDHPNSNVGAKTAVQNLRPRGDLGDFDYSNSGFTLISLAAEKATGVPWKQLVRTMLLEPLELDETGFGPVEGAARPHWIRNGEARPFGQRGWGPTRSVAAVLQGAGDMFATPRDLARFGSLLYGDRLLEGDQNGVINGIANLTGLSWSYTLGSMMDRSWLGTLRTYGHTGGYSGVSTTLRRIPELGLTVAVAANGMGTPSNYADDLAIELVELLDRPAPQSAQSIAGLLGIGSRAASRANPEPLPLPASTVSRVCGDVGLAPRQTGWIALDEGASSDWQGLITSVAELSDGRLLVAGSNLRRAGGVAVNGIALRDPDTGRWSAPAALLDAKGKPATVHAVVIDRIRNRLYVAGDAATLVAQGSRRRVSGVVQMNLETGRWSALTAGLSAERVDARALAVSTADGTLVATGYAGRRGAMFVRAWTGGAWRDLTSLNGIRISGAPEAIGISNAGAITVAGNLEINGSIALIARRSASNGTWDAIATRETLGDAPRSLTILSDGNALVGTGIAWDGATLVRESATSGYRWESLGSGPVHTRRATWISTLATADDGSVLVGGRFDTVGGVAAPNIARWDPATLRWSPVGSGISIEPDAVASSPRVEVYVAHRARGNPGETGRTCIVAFARGLPAAPATPTVIVARKSMRVSWSALDDAADGWVVEVTAKGRASASCRVEAAARSCTVRGLTPGVRYLVTLRGLSFPAGPGPKSAPVAVTTQR